MDYEIHIASQQRQSLDTQPVEGRRYGTVQFRTCDTSLLTFKLYTRIDDPRVHNVMCCLMYY